jgi:hypothetical protein
MSDTPDELSDLLPVIFNAKRRWLGSLVAHPGMLSVPTVRHELVLETVLFELGKHLIDRPKLHPGYLKDPLMKLVIRSLPVEP